MHDVEELDDVGVIHFLEQGYLANSSAGNAFVFGLESDLLQGDDTVRVGELAGLVDDTVGSYA
jgi:hypothetical protein